MWLFWCYNNLNFFMLDDLKEVQVFFQNSIDVIIQGLSIHENDNKKSSCTPLAHQMPCRRENALRESGSTPTGGRKISRSIILSAPPMPAFRMPVAAWPSAR